MVDDHFSRSVIFICEHNDDGSYGFIINNELNLKLDEIIPEKGLPALDVFMEVLFMLLICSTSTSLEIPLTTRKNHR